MDVLLALGRVVALGVEHGQGDLDGVFDVQHRLAVGGGAEAHAQTLVPGGDGTERALQHDRVQAAADP